MGYFDSWMRGFIYVFFGSCVGAMGELCGRDGGSCVGAMGELCGRDNGEKNKTKYI